MKRKHRLSRSRDFDAVYRHGRSVASRYLVLYSFRRDVDEPDESEPRLGLAVPRQVGRAVERNRIKRRLRAAFDELRPDLPVSHDYVLIVKPGFAEAAETHGSQWLLERVREVLEQAGRLREAAGT